MSFSHLQQIQQYINQNYGNRIELSGSLNNQQMQQSLNQQQAQNQYNLLQFTEPIRISNNNINNSLEKLRQQFLDNLQTGFQCNNNEANLILQRQATMQAQNLQNMLQNPLRQAQQNVNQFVLLLNSNQQSFQLPNSMPIQTVQQEMLNKQMQSYIQQFQVNQQSLQQIQQRQQLLQQQSQQKLIQESLQERPLYLKAQSKHSFINQVQNKNLGTKLKSCNINQQDSATSTLRNNQMDNNNIKIREKSAELEALEEYINKSKDRTKDNYTIAYELQNHASSASKSKGGRLKLPKDKYTSGERDNLTTHLLQPRAQKTLEQTKSSNQFQKLEQFRQKGGNTLGRHKVDADSLQKLSFMKDKPIVSLAQNQRENQLESTMQPKKNTKLFKFKQVKQDLPYKKSQLQDQSFDSKTFNKKLVNDTGLSPFKRRKADIVLNADINLNPYFCSQEKRNELQKQFDMRDLEMDCVDTLVMLHQSYKNQQQT